MVLGMREPTYFMLVALAPGEPMHGYAIAKSANEISDGRVTITAGTLYGALDRLVDAGSITLDSEGQVNGRKRRYYRITEQGQSDLTAEVARMQQSIAAAQSRRGEAAAITAPGLAGA